VFERAVCDWVCLEVRGRLVDEDRRAERNMSTSIVNLIDIPALRVVDEDEPTGFEMNQ
jgi:hypothetical protein